MKYFYLFSFIFFIFLEGFAQKIYELPEGRDFIQFNMGLAYPHSDFAKNSFEDKKSGFGLNNMLRRVENMNGIFKIDKENGTVVEMIIPIGRVN